MLSLKKFDKLKNRKSYCFNNLKLCKKKYIFNYNMLIIIVLK